MPPQRENRMCLTTASDPSGFERTLLRQFTSPSGSHVIFLSGSYSNRAAGFLDREYGSSASLLLMGTKTKQRIAARPTKEAKSWTTLTTILIMLGDYFGKHESVILSNNTTILGNC